MNDALPSAGDKVLYVIYDFEATQNNRYTDKSTLHLPKLVCVQKFLFAVRGRGRLRTRLHAMR